MQRFAQTTLLEYVMPMLSRLNYSYGSADASKFLKHSIPLIFEFSFRKQLLIRSEFFDERRRFQSRTREPLLSPSHLHYDNVRHYDVSLRDSF